MGTKSQFTYSKGSCLLVPFVHCVDGHGLREVLYVGASCFKSADIVNTFVEGENTRIVV